MFDKETEMLCITEASRRYNYPRPYSEPPSPSSSRPTTPGASLHGSDDEGIDEEREVITYNNAVVLKHFECIKLAKKQDIGITNELIYLSRGGSRGF